jgi:hypothetical protein
MKSGHIFDLNERSEKIIEFIRTRRISMNQLEKACEMPQGMLSKVLSGIIGLPVKHVRALEKELKKYGFNSKGQ